MGRRLRACIFFISKLNGENAAALRINAAVELKKVRGVEKSTPLFLPVLQNFLPQIA